MRITIHWLDKFREVFFVNVVHGNTYENAARNHANASCMSVNARSGVAAERE